MMIVERKKEENSLYQFSKEKRCTRDKKNGFVDTSMNMGFQFKMGHGLCGHWR